MADEAILRIVLQDMGGGGTPSPSLTPPAPPPPPPVVPVPPPQQKQTPPPQTAPTSSAPAPDVEKPTTVVPVKAKTPAIQERPTGDGEQGGALSEILNIANQFRGTIGGFAGVIIGAALDAMTAFQKAEVEAKRKKREAGVPETGGIPEVLPASEPAPAAAPTTQAAGDATKIAEQFGKPPATGTRGAGATAPSPRPTGGGGIPKTLPVGGEAAAAAEGIGGAEAAGGAMAGMTGAAAAAGPIGAVVAVVYEAIKKINQSIVEGIKSGIGAASKAANLIASPSDDPSAPIAAMGEAASKTGDSLNQLIPGLGNMSVVIGETEKAFASLMQNITKTADRYGEYSPEIASAQAIVEIKRTMGDFRRAQEAGPELARYIQVQGDLQQKFEDIKIKLLTKLLAVVTPVLEIVEAVMPSAQGVESSLNVIAGIVNPIGTIAQGIARIARIQEDDRIPEVADPTNIIFGNDPGGRQVIQPDL